MTEGGRLVKKAFKLVQLDGSSGSPSIKKIQSGSESLGLTKSTKVNESEYRFKISFNYYGNYLPGYRDTSIILTYSSTQIYDYIPVFLKRIHGEIIDELVFTVSGTNGNFIGNDFEGSKPNIEIQIKNKVTGEIFTSTSDSNGTVVFNDIDIYYTEFVMTFRDMEFTNKSYLDKFKIRTDEYINLDNGESVALVKNIETSDWRVNASYIDVTDPVTFWLPGGKGVRAKAFGNELGQISFDIRLIKEFLEQGKKLEIFLIEDSYKNNNLNSTSGGYLRLSDSKLWSLYYSEFVNRFDKEKVLLWIMSEVNQ